MKREAFKKAVEIEEEIHKVTTFNNMISNSFVSCGEGINESNPRILILRHESYDEETTITPELRLRLLKTINDYRKELEKQFEEL